MTCDCNKILYDTYNEAIGAVKGISRRDSGMKAYKCPGGNGYHVATRGKKKIIPNVYEDSKQLNFTNKTGVSMKPLPRQSKPTSFIHSSQKLLTKEQAQNLKRLIEGQNEVDKQKKVL